MSSKIRQYAVGYGGNLKSDPPLINVPSGAFFFYSIIQDFMS